MRLFGVTGGIGSGKTVVCEMLRHRGVPILEADIIAKDLTNSLPAIRTALIRQFGNNIYLPDGMLNKQQLSKFVFQDPEARMRVNRIIHPHVMRFIKAEAHRLQATGVSEVIGVEAALIYESGMDKWLNGIVVVTAPQNKRIQWLLERGGLTRSDIRRRMAAQLPIEEKIEKADYIVENTGSLADLDSKIDTLLLWLMSG